MQRSSGIILHISSLPSPCGIGNLGEAAYRFVDFLKSAGQRYWQILPLGPTGFGDSPYQSFSAFAGNPYFIDPEELVSCGWLSRGCLQKALWGDDPSRVDFGQLYRSHDGIMRQAYMGFCGNIPGDFADFCQKEAAWLEDYCLFRALKQRYQGAHWLSWDAPLRNRKPAALQQAKQELRDEIGFHRFLQYCFYRQWQRLRSYARQQGIRIIGDIPIYVPLDSADVWSAPENFQLTRTRRPRRVAGCPPDIFNRTGQYWGHPIYDWEQMEQDDFDWWLRRIGSAARLYDVIRIDHFRGLESYWSIPGRNRTAQAGQWVKGPGMKLLGRIRDAFPDTEFIAEDLGYPTPEVQKLVADFGFPGMKVLQFAFDDGRENDDQPHRYEENCVCYTGTHDNDTLRGFLESRTDAQLGYIRSYLDREIDPGEGLLTAGIHSAAVLFMSQMQDWLDLSSHCRMNEPGKCNEINWRWRLLPGSVTDELASRIRGMTVRAGRI